MLKEILCFHQSHLELPMKNGNENDNDGNVCDDCILLSGGYSMPDNVLRALHAYSHFITQQLYEVVLSWLSLFTEEGH